MLKRKVGSQVILICNLNVNEGLANCTSSQVMQFRLVDRQTKILYVSLMMNVLRKKCRQMLQLEETIGSY